MRKCDTRDDVVFNESDFGKRTTRASTKPRDEQRTGLELEMEILLHTV